MFIINCLVTRDLRAFLRNILSVIYLLNYVPKHATNHTEDLWQQGKITITKY
jgi:hypothetical protein